MSKFLLFAVVGIQVIIAVIPKQGVRADYVLPATFGIPSMVIGGGRIVEVAKTYKNENI